MDGSIGESMDGSMDGEETWTDLVGWVVTGCLVAWVGGGLRGRLRGRLPRTDQSTNW